MKARMIYDQGERTFAVIFDKGDEVVSGLTEFAKRNDLGGSHFKAIGAFSDLVLGYFNWEKQGL